MPNVASYGTWMSPLSAAMVATAGLRLGAPAIDGGAVYWLEGRPADGGRSVLVRRDADGLTEDVTPREINVRTRVHEYGGGAYVVADGVAYVVNFEDQHIYRVRRGEIPEPVTRAGACCYADLVMDAARDQIICVREDHRGDGEPVNTIVRVPLTGEPGTGEVLVAGHDFYSTPRLSPDGSQLAWLAWRHPQMPWDGTELWVADVAADGTLAGAHTIAGSEHESIYQPGWSPDGTLYFVSDRDGWWKIYRLGRSAGQDRAVARSLQPVVRNPPADAEFGRPQWTFGSTTWACAGPDRLVAAYTRAGRWSLATIHVHTGLLTDLPLDVSPLDGLVADQQCAVFVGASASAPDAVVRLSLASQEVEVLRPASALTLGAGYVSLPEVIEYPTGGGLSAHAFYYPPRNKDFVPPRGERPPLIVICHGGPTTATRATFDLQVQYWTSRGFAVADVNYGGSSGYGRAYRDRLKGNWGIVDVEDTINAASYLVSQAKADMRRLIVRGGSSGGYTVLAALTFHPGVFGAGASYYGVSDIESLARDTHKFEARYLDSLVGPYPEMRQRYHDRSPIHFVDRLSCALILFQGLQDKVVPPDQSQAMADAVRAKGLPVEYHTFPDEQHGFRRAATIEHCLKAELAFYLKLWK